MKYTFLTTLFQTNSFTFIFDNISAKDQFADVDKIEWRAY